MNTKISTTRRADAQQRVNLSQRRTWYADPPADELTDAEWKQEREAAAATINASVGDVLSKAAAIAADERYTLDFRYEQLDELFTGARLLLDQRAAAELSTIEAAIPKLQSAARPPQSPSESDVLRLMYTRDMLLGTLKSAPELMASWKQAITDGDGITAKAIADNLPAMLEKVKYPGGPNIPASMKELQAQTQAMHETTEQRSARKELQRLEARRQAVQIARGKLASEIAPGFQIENKSVLPAYRVSIRRSIKF